MHGTRYTSEFKAKVDRSLQRAIRSLLLISVASLLSVFGTACEAAGRVFLTFDDGPINATLDVLDVLKAQDVKVTFFVNAIHLDGKGGENEDRATEALQRIVSEGHVLGNHSYDHMAHNRPPGIYSIWAAQAYRDVETDLRYFVPDGVASVNAAVGELASRPNNLVNKLARLPFSNVWMLPRLGEICVWCGTQSAAFWHPYARANGEREVSNIGGKLAEALLSRYQMRSIGWDFQWMPTDWTLPNTNETMPSAAVVEKAVVSLMEEGRYCMPVATVMECAPPVKLGNVVVLTHEFLFENGPRGRGRDANLPQLIELITALKRKGYTFDTLDHYSN